MKRLLSAALVGGLLLYAAPAKAITVTTTNLPSMGSPSDTRVRLNQALAVISNGFSRAEFVQTVVETNPVSNTVLSGGDILYVITTGSTATNITIDVPTRQGQRLSVVNSGTQTVKIARSSGGIVYPTSTNAITLGPGTEWGLVSPSLTNWVMRGTYSSP